MTVPFIERQIKRGGVLIALGLVVQLLTFASVHPLAFVVFLLAGCPLVAAGIALYLYSLVAHEPPGSPPGFGSVTRPPPAR
ncbi:MAG: hypothetical protein DMG25_03115 [Acidobacteria bacterium]|nr:MAG: hypothetical protein DMG25_03115 [Acidobacteriota bacterium]PYV23774.1 MAG: hypothetical protein DMG27_14740 [Acidobacteriota bacterium]